MDGTSIQYIVTATVTVKPFWPNGVAIDFTGTKFGVFFCSFWQYILFCKLINAYSFWLADDINIQFVFLNIYFVSTLKKTNDYIGLMVS